MVVAAPAYEDTGSIHVDLSKIQLEECGAEPLDATPRASLHLPVAREREATAEAVVSQRPSAEPSRLSTRSSEGDSAGELQEPRAALEAWLKRMEREHTEHLRVAVDLVLEDWTSCMQQVERSTDGGRSSALNRFRTQSQRSSDPHGVAVQHSQTYKKMHTAADRVRPLYSSHFNTSKLQPPVPPALTSESKNFDDMGKRNTALLHFRSQKPRFVLENSETSHSSSTVGDRSVDAGAVEQSRESRRVATERTSASRAQLAHVEELSTAECTEGSSAGPCAWPRAALRRCLGCCPWRNRPPTPRHWMITVDRMPSVAASCAVLRMTYSKWFCLFRMLVVFFDMAFIGSRVHCRLIDDMVKSPGQLEKLVCDDNQKEITFWGEAVCFAFFTWETCVVLFASGYRTFFNGANKGWNRFDASILVVSAFHFAFDAWPNMTFLRLFRAAHMLTRVKAMEGALRQFRITLMVLRKGIQPLTSTLAVVAYVIYIWAVVLCSGIFGAIGSSSTGGDGDASHRAEKLPEGLKEFYGDFFRVMQSLMMALTGGQDWTAMQDPLRKLHPALSALFIFYVAIMVMGVMNVVTGLFVDRAMIISQLDRDTQVKEQIEQEDCFVKELQKIFKEADADKSGMLSWDEFREIIEDPRIAATLMSLDLEVSEAKSLFEILDYSSSGEVDLDDFTWGFMRLKGNAKSADLCTLLYEHRQLKAKLGDVFDAMNERLDDLESYITERHLELQSDLECKLVARDLLRNGAPAGQCTSAGRQPSQPFANCSEGEEDPPPSELGQAESHALSPTAAGEGRPGSGWPDEDPATDRLRL